MADINYVDSKTARNKLNVCNKTLRNWALAGKIDFILTEGGWRKYNIDKYFKKNNLFEKKKVCYCRVSSHDQKNDLANQVSYLMNKYPDHEIITDIGSGINFKRKGLRKLIDMSINNELEEIVVTYKDRLCRIGYNLLEFIFDRSKTRIIIENAEFKRPEEEITSDLIEIITVYSSKLYGSRSYKKPII